MNPDDTTTNLIQALTTPHNSVLIRQYRLLSEALLVHGAPVTGCAVRISVSTTVLHRHRA